MRLPLMIDAHNHGFRGSKWAHKGTLETETKSALVSGFGTVLTMPNSNPPIMTYNELADVQERVREQAYCDVGFHFGSVGDNFLEFPHVWPLVYGLKVYLGETTGGYKVSVSTAEKIFQAWTVDKPILVHAEGAVLLKKVLRLASKHDRQLHVCHVSLAEEIIAIRKAKRDRQNVTAEVCPHHLIFTKDDLAHLGPYGLMLPPLGQLSDMEALWRGIRDGTVDIIATDHAPHSQEEKASASPPFGVIGEPAFSVMWKHFSEQGLPVEELTRLMCDNPTRIFGVQTDPESFMEIDLDDEFEVTRETIQSKAGRSPYEGMIVKGRIRKIHLHGTLVYEDGEFIGREGRVI